MNSLIARVGGMLLAQVAAWLKATKADNLGKIDLAVNSAEHPVVAAIDAALTGHGVFGLFATQLKPVIDAAVANLVASGESHLGSLYDAGVAALGAEAAKLEAE